MPHCFRRHTLEHKADRSGRNRRHCHWQIETTSHYRRDVTFGEDKSRIRTNPGVFARLRSFAFNILKSHKTSTLSQDRYRATLGGIEGHAEQLEKPSSSRREIAGAR